MEQLKKKDIGAEAYYVNPVHTMPFYRKSFGSRRLPETEKASKQVLSLPIHPGITEAQVEYIADTLLNLL